MKISKVTPYLFHPGVGKNLLFCRVETDEGLYGWGEAYVVQGKEQAVEAYIRGMAPYLIGRDPFNIRHTANAFFSDFAIRRSSCDFFAAFSAVEIALWDILGKYLKQPVYNLIGGRSRERVRLYANGWYDVNFKGHDSTNGVAEQAARVRDMGYTALKWDPFGKTPWRNFPSARELDAAADNVRAVREAVGPGVDLLIEVHRRLSPYNAIRFAERIEPYDIFWFEEPCLADNLELVTEARRHIRAPIVTGETKYSKEDYKEVFEKRAAEIINPDICACGGIHALMEIASMAEPYSVLVSPHNYNSTVIGFAATVHAAASISNFVITEYFLNVKAACDELIVNPIEIRDGFAELPTAPGLGVDLNMDVLLAHPYKEFKKEFPIKGVAHYYEEGPRKSDFCGK